MSAWVLVGSPNSGKTTLYNWLTGSKFKTVNYPGATVDYSVGQLQSHLSEQNAGYSPVVIDTPGIYSLQAQSEDEKVTYGTLFEEKAQQKEINGIIFVIDGTQLGRHLALAEHIRQTGYPVVFAVTMVDLLQKNKMQINLDLLKKELNAPVILFDGLLGSGLPELAQQMKATEKEGVVVKNPVWDNRKQEQTLKHTMAVAEKIILNPNRTHPLTEATKKIDNILLHPFFGLVLFFFFMTLLFSSIYSFTTPVMDLIDSSFGSLAEKVTQTFPGLIGDFLGQGLVAAVGGVVIFVPQIFVLFFGIGILESTGYLARVAALIDKPLSFIGLGGRSFVPLLSGFACAIPAIMATRNITSRKEKVIAQMIIPFMTCSARLPVFALMISFLVGGEKPLVAGFIMAALYFFALLVGAIAAGILSKVIDSNQKPRLMLELPLYRRPRLRVLLNQSVTKSKNFLKKAGPIILVLAIVLWVATTFPRPPEGVEMTEAQIAQQSYAAQAGRAIEPIFKPMGVDWRVGFGIMSAFAAREVFVSALVLMFNVDGADDDAKAASLVDTMREATFADGTKIFTVASVVGILIFFTIALQCIATFAILKREAGAWGPAVAQLVISNVTAYILAVIAFQILRSLGL